MNKNKNWPSTHLHDAALEDTIQLRIPFSFEEFISSLGLQTLINYNIRGQLCNKLIKNCLGDTRHFDKDGKHR